MASPKNWKPRLLYVFLIGKRVGNDRLLEPHEIASALGNLYAGIMTTFGNMTRIRTLDAVGETQNWGLEPSTLVFILAEIIHEGRADSFLATEGATIMQMLEQQEVW